MQRRLQEVKGLDNLSIPRDVQAQLKRRFASVADAAAGVHILWVDDMHPYQNARERRVLTPLSISIDTASSTLEATKWLDQVDYDILITDLTRGNTEPVAKCSDAPDAKQRAGCDLINKVRARPEGANLPVIVYASQIKGVISPAENLAVTNKPGDLFNAIVDAIGRIKRPEYDDK